MPYYLIIRGPLGCGKSTISEKLSQELGAKHVAVDRVLDKHQLTGNLEDGYISQKSFKRANEIITPEAEKTLQAGRPIIFDGNFYWQSQIEDLLARLDYPHRVFTLTAPLAVCIERDKSRNKTHGEDAANAVYEKIMSFIYGAPVDATHSVDECVAEIKRSLPS